MNGIIDWPGLGTVVLTVNRRARRFVARWRDGAVHLTVPPGATAADVTRALAELAPRLAAKRPQAQYAEGTVVDQPDFRVRLRVTRDARGGVGVRGNAVNLREKKADMAAKLLYRFRQKQQDHVRSELQYY